MKKFVYSITLIVLMSACQKEQSGEDSSLTPTSESSETSINIAAIKSAVQTELVNLNLGTKKQQSTPISAYVMGSVLFDPNSLSIGYTGDDKQFHLVSVITGKPTKTITIPGEGFISQTFVNKKNNTLFGLQYRNNTNYILKFNIATGVLLAESPINLGQGINACSYFYNEETNTYYLMRADNMLLAINPDNGVIKKSVPITEMMNNATYDKKHNRIIGLTYSMETKENFIVALNAETGDVISKTSVKEQNDYYACVADYDLTTDSYLVVSAKKELLFLDVNTGSVKKQFPLDFDIKQFCFWRGN
jgi:outer membrane protein assembly factor BamB